MVNPDVVDDPAYLRRLAALGLTLPDPPSPAANYIPAKRHGRLLFVAGQLPFVDGELMATGRLGAGIGVDAGRELARVASLNALAVANRALGTLHMVEVVQLTVFVASDADFYLQHLVADGASDLLVAVLADAGRHVRTAVATPVLPLNSPVEIQVIFSLNHDQPAQPEPGGST